MMRKERENQKTKGKIAGRERRRMSGVGRFLLFVLCAVMAFPPGMTQVCAAAKKTDDWLHVKKNKIVDSSGTEVWLTGVNWFGYNTGTNTFDGLWNVSLSKSLKAIADHGFNLIRVPISAELLLNWSKHQYPAANFNQQENPELVGKNSLQIFDVVLKLCKKNGLKIMLDIHSAETNASGHEVAVWYTDRISTKQYYQALQWVAKRYKNDDTILAIDLKNEPHGGITDGTYAVWNQSKSKNNWKYVAETAAKKVLKKNPHLLIMIEGIEIYPIDPKSNNYTSTNPGDYYYSWWGGNLRGVRNAPVNVGKKYQSQIVYSPHDYGPAVYQQPWFQKNFSYSTLMKDYWRDSWFFIYEKKIAPLLIGEWGGYMTQPNLKWLKAMRKLIKKYKLHHTFWCFNANSGDTGGLVKDDFSTWDTKKYNLVKQVLWKKNGKFVGLDHEVPLGKKGMTLKKYKSLS